MRYIDINDVEAVLRDQAHRRQRSDRPDSPHPRWLGAGRRATRADHHALRWFSTLATINLPMVTAHCPLIGSLMADTRRVATPRISGGR
jgi:hypothetical protein